MLATNITYYLYYSLIVHDFFRYFSYICIFHESATAENILIICVFFCIISIHSIFYLFMITICIIILNNIAVIVVAQCNQHCVPSELLLKYALSLYRRHIQNRQPVILPSASREARSNAKKARLEYAMTKTMTCDVRFSPFRVSSFSWNTVIMHDAYNYNDKYTNIIIYGTFSMRISLSSSSALPTDTVFLSLLEASCMHRYMLCI